MKALFTLILITFLGFTAQAQQTISDHDKKMETLSTQLSMDDTQKANVSKTIKVFDQKTAEVNASNLSTEDKKEQVQKIVAQKEKNIKSYLSEEQFKNYKKLQSAKQ